MLLTKALVQALDEKEQTTTKSLLLVDEEEVSELINDDNTTTTTTTTNDVDETLLFQQLSELSLEQGDNQEALYYAQQALLLLAKKRRQKKKYDDTVVTGDTYLVLGKIFLDRADLATAAPCLQAAFETFSRLNHSASSSSSVADAMYCIGCVHECRKEWDEAIVCFQETLKIRQQQQIHHEESSRRDDDDHDALLVADVLFRLGINHKQQQQQQQHDPRRQLELASACFAECLRVRTIAAAAAKEDDDIGCTILVADALYELAGTIIRSSSLQQETTSTTTTNLDPTECYVDAIRIYKKASSSLSLEEDDDDNNKQQRKQQQQHSHHIKIAKCLARLAKIMESSNDDNDSVEKASSCYQQAVSIFESELPPIPTHEALMDYRIELDYEAYIEVLLDYAVFLHRNTTTDNNNNLLLLPMDICHRAVTLLQSGVRVCENDEAIDTALRQVAGILNSHNRPEESLQLLQKVEERKATATTTTTHHWWSRSSSSSSSCTANNKGVQVL